jgi:2-aminoethylphosphonate-pyruvate transaminase
MSTSIPGWKDNVLFTPGPLTTSQTVKQALLRDLGSRDHAFIEMVREIRRRLLDVGQVSAESFTAIPMQGSGTFSIEAVFASTVRPDGKVLLVINGAYGQRMEKICQVLGIETTTLISSENELPDLDRIRAALAADSDITDLATVHCETTTGIINPVEAIGVLAKEFGVSYFVDAMSSFGAVPLDLEAAQVDYLVSSANKCIEGVPGFGFVIARKSSLNKTEGWARSLSLDLLSQNNGLDANGQFRFTPPTHVLLAFHQALLELEAEGGVKGRAKRYRSNYECLVEGMAQLGFAEYLSRDVQGYIITSFLYPDNPNWDFNAFYDRLNERGYTIYPGKVSNADCFRIGNIGRVFSADVQGLLAAVREVMSEMDIVLTNP